MRSKNNLNIFAILTLGLFKNGFEIGEKPEIYELSLSLVLLLASVYIYLGKKTEVSKSVKFIFSFGVFISILAYIFYGIADYFTGNGITSAVLYYLKYGLSGAGFSEYIGLILISLFLVLLGAGFSILLIFKKKSEKNRKYTQICLIFSLLFISFFINPVSASLKEIMFEKTIELNFDEDSEFLKYYKIPELKQIGKAKNLVFIYGEGLERTYFDEVLFPGLTKNLQEIESKSISFTSINQDKYSHHTMGGIVASQCGFPLISPSHANSMSGMDTYLESAVCLGDLLDREGYYLSYYGGAGLNFAGKGKFFSSHGFNEIKGRGSLLSELENPDYLNGWGLYDDSLFDLAYERFNELSEKKDKFAMFLLTLDTHHPKGNPSKSCENIIYKNGKNSILNSVACSDYLISEFIKKIRQSEYSDETVIVIVSDHLAMRNTATELLSEGNRKNLFLINEADSKNGIKIDKPGLTLDVGSTVMPFIGYSGEIGFGRNIINTEKSDSRIENIINNLTDFKPYIMQFWNFPKIKNFIKINLNKKRVFIDNREFKIPILINLNDQLETKLKFKLSNIDKNEYFLLISECDKINSIANTKINYSGLCLLTAKDGQYNYIELTSNTELSKEEIREITGMTSSKLEENKFLIKRIAHAGGGINGKTYTNSIEALDANYQKGFSYFEIDFIFTEDEQLVCLHDWNFSFEKIFGFKTDKKLTLKEFNQLLDEKAEFRACTLSELINWMNENPDSYIITDVKGANIKENNIKALEIISENVPDFKKRIIPQIYYSENFNNVKKIGYNQIIWTLYRSDWNDEEVLNNVKNFSGPFAITMTKEKAMSGLATKLFDINIPTYAHTVNLLENADELFKKYNITEIYTDFLEPN